MRRASPPAESSRTRPSSKSASGCCRGCSSKGRAAMRDSAAADADVPASPMLASWQLSGLTVLAVLGVWWLVTWAAVIPPLYLPGPRAAFGKLVEVYRAGYMDATL